jgi:hypothetical protein
MRTPADTAARRAAATGSAILAACALAAPAGAAAAAAPAAITGPVTAVATTTATLSGTVNPNGVAVTWQFDYGISTAYGQSTTATGAGAGTANSGVSATLSGLTPGTTYHYRLEATSAGGTADGADGIFTTASSVPPAATTSAATAVGTSTATLNGSVTPNGQATSSYFQYGPTTGYGLQTGQVSSAAGTAAVAVSATVSGLRPGQTYHFRLVATSSAGTTDGADLTFTAAAAPAAAPAAVTRPATSVGLTGATLNASVTPNGQATTYYFQYGATAAYGSRTATASAGSGTSPIGVTATLSGLSPGVYHFRVVASSSAGTSYGADLTFGSTGPPAVQTGSAEGASTSGATLTGTVNPEGNATSWYFQYGTTSAYGLQTPSRSAGSGGAVTGVAATIDKLSAGTTYHYRLVGVSGAGTTYGGDVTLQTVVAVTLNSQALELVYGQATTLSGAVFSRQAGVTVTLLAQPYGASSFAAVGSAETGLGGSWTFQVKPRVQTAYEASIQGGTSTPMTVGVRPAVTLHLITGNRLATRVLGDVSFAGRTVQLQRLFAGATWQTVAKARLNANSAAVFPAVKLPRGLSDARIAMSVNQAGPGFLAGFSRTLGYRRR